MNRLIELKFEIEYAIKMLHRIYQKLSNLNSLPEVIYETAKLVSDMDRKWLCGKNYVHVEWMSENEMRMVNGFTNDDMKLIGYTLTTAIDVLGVEKRAIENLLNNYFSSVEEHHGKYTLLQAFRNVCHVIDELGRLMMWMQARLLRKAEQMHISGNLVDKALSMGKVINRRGCFHEMDL